MLDSEEKHRILIVKPCPTLEEMDVVHSQLFNSVNHYLLQFTEARLVDTFVILVAIKFQSRRSIA